MKHSKLRRKLFQSIIVVFILGLFIPSYSFAAEAVFTDVPEGHDQFEVVNDLNERGVLTGYPDGEFKADNTLTRVEASQLIAKLLELKASSDVADFSDVNPDSWYYDSVNALYDAGFINGFDNGTFQPYEEITRVEFASILADAYGIKANIVELPYTDVEEGAWYESAVKALYSNGLMVGIGSDVFGVSDTITRGEAVEVLAETDELFEGFNLTLMHTSDTHAHLDDVAKRVSAVNDVKNENPDALLLDAGDVFSGTLYFNEFEGQADIEFMNLMGYDAMTFGNHEFDLGSNDNHLALSEFVKAAEFPFLGTNVDFSENEYLADLQTNEVTDSAEDATIYNGIVKEVNGEKVGIFGLTTEETADISSPEDVLFEDYLDKAEETVAAFEALGINKIIAVTHIGYDDNPEYDNDLILAEEVEGIDVILGGHSHTTLDEPVVVDEDGTPTIISHTGEYGNALGTLDLVFDEQGVVKYYHGELLDVGEYEANPEAVSMLEGYASKVDEVKNEESGATAVEELSNPRLGDGEEVSVRNSETPLGNLITDGMLSKALEYNENVVAAFQNGGGIRAAIDQGPITIGEIITVLPFGNTLATMNITGAEIIAALEHSVSQAPNESGGFLHVSGMKLVYDSTKPAGERVVSVEFVDAEGNTVPLDESETYTIATNAFTAKGGDGYDMFAKAYEEGRVTDLGLSDWENFREHLAGIGEVVPQTEERIIDQSQVDTETEEENTEEVEEAEEVVDETEAAE